MAPLRAARPTLAGAVTECQDVVSSLNEACKQAAVLKEECLRLGKFTKRLGPLLDDLKDNMVEPNAEQKGVAALKDVTKALQRCTAAITRCGSMGPLQALLQAVSLAQDLTDGGIDLQAALAAMDAGALGVATDLQEDLAQFVRQLARANVCVFPAAAHQLVAELQIEAEKVRSCTADVRELSALMTGQVLAQCSVQQLQCDAAFIEQRRAEAAAAGGHVAGAFYQQMGHIVQAMLPKPGAAGAGAAAATATQQASGKPGTLTSQTNGDSPTASAQQLLAALCSSGGGTGPSGSGSSAALGAARLQAALPLLLALGVEDGAAFLPSELPVAAGALPAVERDDLLQCLSDVAQLKPLAALLTAADVDALTKGAVACILERSSNADNDVVAAIVACGCMDAWVRHLQFATTSKDLKVQLLSLLVPLARNSPIAQQQMVAATAIPGLIQLVATVRIVKGVATAVAPTAAVAADAATMPDAQPPASRKGAAAAAAATAGSKAATRSPQKGVGFNTDANSQGAGRTGGRGVQYDSSNGSSVSGKGGSNGNMPDEQTEAPVAVGPADVESLALQLLAILANKYKAEVVSAGGLAALAQVLAGSQPDGIKAGAAAALMALVGDDKMTGLQAVKGDLLMPLARAWSTGGTTLRQLALEAMLQLLQPIVILDTPAPAPILRGASLSAAAARAAAATATGPGSATAGGAAGATAMQQSGTQEDAEAEAVAEVGRAFGPSSVTAAMYLLSKDERALELPLVRVLRHAAATQPARAAAFSHDSGLQRLVELACSCDQGSGPRANIGVGVGGAGQAMGATALDVLRALCEEKDSKALLAPRLAKLLQGSSAQRPACAHVVAKLAPAPGATAKDKAAAKASAQFCMALKDAGGIQPLAELLRSPQPETKATGVEAVRAMCVWGDADVRSAVLQAQAVQELIDVVKAGPVEAPLCTAATEALAVLAAEGTSAAQQIFDSLVAYLKPASPALAYNAAYAARRIAGDNVSHITLLGKAGAPTALVRLLKEGSGHNLTAASSLLLAVTRGSAGEANAAAAAAEGAVAVLLRLLKSGEEGVRVAAAGVVGVLARRSAQDRDAVHAARGVPDLVDVLKGADPELEGWEDAAQALAVMAVFCDAARPEVVRAMRTLLARGSGRECSAAAAVVAGLAASPKGREALLSEGLLAGMVGLLATGTAASKAAAADALTKLAAPAYVQLGAAEGGSGRSSGSSSGSSGSSSGASKAPASGRGGGATSDSAAASAPSASASAAAAAAPGRKVDPKVEVVKAGAIAPLVALVRSPPDEQCLVEACEALYCLAGCTAGLTAARQSGLVDVLQSVVLRGKRKEIGEKAAKAAYETLMRVL